MTSGRAFEVIRPNLHHLKDPASCRACWGWNWSWLFCWHRSRPSTEATELRPDSQRRLRICSHLCSKCSSSWLLKDLSIVADKNWIAWPVSQAFRDAFMKPRNLKRLELNLLGGPHSTAEPSETKGTTCLRQRLWTLSCGRRTSPTPTMLPCSKLWMDSYRCGWGLWLTICLARAN